MGGFTIQEPPLSFVSPFNVKATEEGTGGRGDVFNPTLFFLTGEKKIMWCGGGFFWG